MNHKKTTELQTKMYHFPINLQGELIFNDSFQHKTTQQSHDFWTTNNITLCYLIYQSVSLH